MNTVQKKARNSRTSRFAPTGGLSRRLVVTGGLGLMAGCTTKPLIAKHIDEAGWTQLGGIQQWMTVRGSDLQNPILLHVHGGPGFTTSAFAQEFKVYDTSFTVVQWDQRGAGRTFGRYGENTPDLTLERIASDGVELAIHLTDRFGNVPIVLFGHSMGTVTAIKMLQRAPELFSAYVGAGQFASFSRTVTAQLDYLQGIVTESQNEALRDRLVQIGYPNPASIDDFFAVNRLLAPHTPDDDQDWFRHMQERLPEVMSQEQLDAWNHGREFSGDVLMPQAVDVDLFASAPVISVPLLIVQGAEDVYTPTKVATDYFQHVQSPKKHMERIERSGHFAHLTHSAEFLAAIMEAKLL